jgi:hypothetical protein
VQLGAVYVEDAGMTLVSIYDRGCNSELDHVAISQSATTVTVKVVARYMTPPVEHNASIGCPMYAAERTASVRLESPLGARSIVDGVTGKAISANAPLSPEAAAILAGRDLVPCHPAAVAPCWTLGGRSS